jgi:hypothetical protein
MADRTLQVLYASPRKGYEGKPDLDARLTLESWNGNRYAMWGVYRPDSGKAEKAVSIRHEELGALIPALQRAQELWETPDERFAGDLTHAEYAKTLDWV